MKIDKNLTNEIDKAIKYLNENKISYKQFSKYYQLVLRCRELKCDNSKDLINALIGARVICTSKSDEEHYKLIIGELKQIIDSKSSKIK